MIFHAYAEFQMSSYEMSRPFNAIDANLKIDVNLLDLFQGRKKLIIDNQAYRTNRASPSFDLE